MAALRVGVLAYPGCFASEVFGVPDLLGMAEHVSPSDQLAYDVVVVSPRRKVAAVGGHALQVNPLRPVDVLVVPGFEFPPGLDLDRRMQDLRLELAVIAEAGASGVAIVSICVGAFLLAEAGLLDGRQATTSWLHASALAERHPSLDLDASRLVVTDRGVTTTGAFSAMYDFALSLIREHSGPGVARAAARIALVDDARSSQSPYVDERLLPPPGDEFSQRVMRHLEQNLAERYSLGSLAVAFDVSPRTMLRRFGAGAAQSPLDYLQGARIRRARHLLESTDRNVAVVAAAVGYRDPANFAALFRERTGQRPSEYRAAFRRGRRPIPQGEDDGAPAAVPAR